LGDDDITGG
jgi:hypothetical protein